MTSQKHSPVLSTGPAASGFFAAPSRPLPIRYVGRKVLSRVEGAAQKRFRLVAVQASLPLVAVLFARSDSVYKRLPGCDVWDIDRDARHYSGCLPVVAHPPCRAWAGLRHMAKPRPDEKELALFAVAQVRRCGGVLEHPARSTLWQAAGLPLPGSRDDSGGFTFAVCQSDFGHKAKKATWLYVCGIEPSALPVLPIRLGEASHILGTSGRRQDGTRSNRRLEISKIEREATPVDFAAWLYELALLCVNTPLPRSGIKKYGYLCNTRTLSHGWD